MKLNEGYTTKLDHLLQKSIRYKHHYDIVNFVSILLYKNVIDKGFAEIFYKMKSFVFFLE